MVILIGVIVYQNQQIRKLFHVLDSANETTGKLMAGQGETTQKSAPRITSHVGRGSGQDDYDDIRYKLEAAEEELDMTHEQLFDEIARNDENETTMMQGPLALLKTPEGKKRCRTA